MNYKKAAAEAVVSALGSDQITIEQAERLMAVPPNPEMGTSRSPVSPLQNNFASLLSQSLQNFRKIIGLSRIRQPFYTNRSCWGYLNFLPETRLASEKMSFPKYCQEEKITVKQTKVRENASLSNSLLQI